ncbi:Crp/Fnr family transcriptional regulator [Telluribacter sp. SYSU D00476]|uniref:Crp/Fnr family transcriptional regulator n=1 Tax=Telluribacter sp. SYSU D00476 TaxID=2811430 RepID=UPI001FF3C560|nr:Crp/Fnr family transcriptional regulator [Telluribacter sp. SYSU D00476]
MENVIRGIRKYYPVSDRSISQLAQNFREQYLPKHHLLTRAGVRDHSVYFIESGCSRTYLLIDGKEITNWFSREGDITFSSNALYHQTAGFEYVELLEDSKLYVIPIESLNELYETNIEIANWSRVIHQEVLLKMQTLRIDRLSLSAKERYDKFIQENPDLFQRVNLGYIASYLGMTQQYLSNLRADVRF